MVKRFEIFLLNLDEAVSDDARNTRPCVVISPDEINQHLDFTIVAPISSVTQKYPTRILFEFLNKERAIVLDQIQTVEKSRLSKKIGEIAPQTQKQILETLQELFAE